jgi:hypothetical protein
VDAASSVLGDGAASDKNRTEGLRGITSSRLQVRKVVNERDWNLNGDRTIDGK